jgi:multiple sugar transport system permease protein
MLDQEAPLGYLLLVPAMVVLGIFVAYPFAFGIWLATSNTTIGNRGDFIGAENFAYLFRDPIFIRTLQNTFLYTFVTIAFKFGLGLAMAAVLNVKFRFNRFARSAMLLPWIIPTVLSTLAWLWMFDGTFSVFNWVLGHVFHVRGPYWLGQGSWPIASLMLVNIWRGTPFFGISLLAAMQTVPQDLYEAAAVDGASAWSRWLHVTLPMIRPVILIVTLLSIILTFADFQIIWILTRGGPANSTHVLSTYAFAIGIQGTDIGIGAAAALAMFPVLCVTIGVVLWLLRRE